MSKWRCGDCGCQWTGSVRYCPHTFDDYLSLRGGSVESAISRAVERAIEPLVRDAERRLAPAPYSPSLGYGIGHIRSRTWTFLAL